MPKAPAVHLPPLSTVSCDTQLYSDCGSVYSHASHAGTSYRTCAASNHVRQEPHQPCSPDLRAHPISQQCATSHGPPEQSSVVKYQMSIPLQCPLCYAQPSSHYGYGSEEEDGGGGGASTTILMSGDVEMNPGPVGGWTLLMYFEFRAV